MELLGPGNTIAARFLKFFFSHLYHDWAGLYDWVADGVSIGLWRKWIGSCLPYLKGQTILELGHGPGHLQVQLVARGYKTIGLDPSQQMGRIASHRLKKFLQTSDNGYANKNLVRAQAQEIPLPAKSVDSVVSTFPSEYIFSPNTLASVYRVLRPGGELIILLTGWITGKSLLLRAAGWLFRITGESGEWDPQWAHPLQDAGFIPSVGWIELETSRVLMIRAIRPESTDLALNGPSIERCNGNNL